MKSSRYRVSQRRQPLAPEGKIYELTADRRLSGLSRSVQTATRSAIRLITMNEGLV